MHKERLLMRRKIILLFMFVFIFALPGCALSTPEGDLDAIVEATLAAIDAAQSAEPENTPVPTATQPISEPSVTPTPTETMVPTPQTDAEAIKAALNAYLPNPVDEGTIMVSEIVGKLARGGLPGAYFIAAKEGETWIIIYAGQATPYCNVINPYAFPTAWVPECLDEDGTLIERSEEEGSTVVEILGSPTWTDTMDSNKRWYLLSTDNAEFKMESSALVMTVFSAGGYDEWGVAAGADQTDFYLEVTAKTGGKCSGKDRYGVIFRVPDPSEGYIFEFSCDGRFRLYEWDGENYSELQGWKSNSAILTGPSKENRLGLMVAGDQATLYANDQQLGEYTLEDYPQGRFGLVIGSSETDNFKVSIDTVRFWNLAGS
jgi:outer membrane protein assembly factor BamE (lipoprotein component of BamABCDE complex)